MIRRFRSYIYSSMVCGILFSMAITGVAGAATFSQNNIINDVVFDNANTMTATQIDAFLNTFPSSCISTNHGFSAPEPIGVSPTGPTATLGMSYGSDVTAGTVIYNAAKAYGLNPKVLLSTLEKEEALVTGGAGCSNLRYSAALGFNCPDATILSDYSGFELYSLNGSPVNSVTGICVQHDYFVGFSRQVIFATWLLKRGEQRSEGNVSWNVQLRDFPHTGNAWDNSDDPTRCYSGPMTQGNFKRCSADTSTIYYDGYDTIDGASIHLDDGATAALYWYTPHFHGNQLFFDIFNGWFGSTYASAVPYDWGIVSQEAYLDTNRTQAFTDGVVRIAPAQTAYLRVKVRNFGFNTWDQSLARLGTTNPFNRSSVFANNTWLSAGRLQMLETSVPPGGTATFVFSVTAPQAVGNYYETFDMVAEGITWMPDQNLGYYIDVNNTVQPLATQFSLATGSILQSGQTLVSQDLQSALEIQRNGNLILFNDFKQSWSTNTTSTTPVKLIMQVDGNLVLYDNAMRALWNSGTSGNSGAHLVLQPDGNLVIYTSLGVALWSSGTVHIPDGLAYVNTRTYSSAHLVAGQQLQTADRNFRMVLQGDGNLVLYNKDGLALWQSATSGNQGASFYLQTDGNMVIYSKDGVALWSSWTSSHPASRLAVQPDGNLVLYGTAGQPLWQSGTVQKTLAATSTNSIQTGQQLLAGQQITATSGAYRLVLQTDGNLVLYDAGGIAYWSSRTGGKPIYRAILQTDGNLVLYDAGGIAYWSSGTAGRGSSTLIIQADRNLALYDLYSHLTWSTNTGV